MAFVRRHPIAIAVVLVVVAALAAATYASWIAVSAWQASKVSVLSTQLSECADEDASVVGLDDRTDLDGDREQIPEVVVRLDERLDCVLMTDVENHARTPIEVERISWPFLGPDGHITAELTPTPTGGLQTVADRADVTRHATFDTIGRAVVEPSEWKPFAVRLRFSPGCKANGAETYVGDSPTATIRVLGRSHTIRATAGEGVGFRGTAETDCDD